MLRIYSKLVDGDAKILDRLLSGVARIHIALELIGDVEHGVASECIVDFSISLWLSVDQFLCLCSTCRWICRLTLLHSLRFLEYEKPSG